MKLALLVILLSLLSGPHPRTAFSAVSPGVSWARSDQSWPGLERAAEYAFEKKSDVLLVIKDGVIVYEKYTKGYTRTRRHRLWSISKSVMNALFAIAIKEKRLSLDDPVHHYYPSMKRKGVEKILIRHLLNMTSGLSWSENYINIFGSDVISMLYSVGQSDMPQYVSRAELAHPPGERFLYSSGDSNLLMGILRKTMSEQEYKDYPWKKLFEPLGIEKAVWEKDRAGNYVGSSYLYTTAEELARLGQLYLNGGVWGAQKFFPDGWMEFTLTPPAAYDFKARRGRPGFGAHFWLNRSGDGVPPPWPDAPESLYASLGYWGQCLFVLPEEKIIVVRFAREGRTDRLDRNLFLKSILAGVGGQSG